MLPGIASSPSPQGSFSPAIEGSATDRASAAQAADALPCLLSPKSDSYRENVTGKHRKTAESLSQNIDGFCRKFGASTGFFTITFAEDITSKEGHRRIANFKRRVLRNYFGASIKVRHFTVRGRPHFHILIDCAGDITTGFNWAYYKQMQDWSREGCKGEKPRGNLNRTDHLRRLHILLQRRGKAYGLGRMELVPVRNPKAAGRYVGGYLGKGIENRPADAKGSRAVIYSRNCPRVFGREWSWNNEAGWLWRAKVGTWAQKFGCRDLREVTGLFGPRWAYHHREHILKTVLSFYPTWEHANRDGRDVKHIPTEATNLEFVTGHVPPLQPLPGNACAGVGGESNAGGSVQPLRAYNLNSPKIVPRGGGNENCTAPQMENAPSTPLPPLRRYVLPGKRVVRVLLGAERGWATSEKLFPCPSSIAVPYGIPD
jgi:hypothetical protein